MRILYFSRDYTPHDHRFLSALAQTQHRVYYLRLECNNQGLEDRPVPTGVEQVGWSDGQAVARLKDGPHLLAELRKVIARVKPDLIQAGPLQRSAFLVALSGFHPLVSMSWGYDLLRDAKINPLWGWATRYTLHRTDALVGDCDTIRRVAISYGMPPERIVTFPWGVDINHFNVPTFQRSDVPTFKLLSTRAWEPIYGIDIIARAFVQAAKKCPELQLTLLGSGSMAAPIRQILLIGGVYDRVKFAGNVSFVDLPAYYHQPDIYVSASHSDGTSISLLEAFACGKPAIVSDIPGNCEWVKAGENGWLFKDGEAEDLASKILTAYGERQNLLSMGMNARQLVEERGDWEKNFPKLEQAYALALK
jgi:L-malate glycosyltransferase